MYNVLYSPEYIGYRFAKFDLGMNTQTNELYHNMFDSIKNVTDNVWNKTKSTVKKHLIQCVVTLMKSKSKHKDKSGN